MSWATIAVITKTSVILAAAPMAPPVITANIKLNAPKTRWPTPIAQAIVSAPPVMKARLPGMVQNMFQPVLTAMQSNCISIVRTTVTALPAVALSKKMALRLKAVRLEMRVQQSKTPRKCALSLTLNTPSIIISHRMSRTLAISDTPSIPMAAPPTASFLITSPTEGGPLLIMSSLFN